jgi:hypothetical protein
VSSGDAHVQVHYEHWHASTTAFNTHKSNPKQHQNNAGLTAEFGGPETQTDTSANPLAFQTDDYGL